jgi:Flp pilus assembly protein TadD
VAEAEKELTLAVKLEPKSAFYHGALGAVLIFEERWADAELQLRAAVQLEPENKIYEQNLKRALSKQGKKLKPI